MTTPGSAELITSAELKTIRKKLSTKVGIGKPWKCPICIRIMNMTNLRVTVGYSGYAPINTKITVAVSIH